MAKTVLQLDRVSKRFGGLLAVSNVTLSVERGERVVVLGPNGAGKTTLFHCITGTLPITSGAIRLLDRNVTRLPADKRVALGIGRTFQITNLFTGLSVLENVMLAIHGRKGGAPSIWRPWAGGQSDVDTAKSELDRVGLADLIRVPVSSLAYGQRRKLELAMAMVGDPKVLFLDEPCAGLAPAERLAFADVINEIANETTVVMVEHDMDIAFKVARRLVVMNMGEVICDGSPEQIRSDQRVQEVYLGHG